MQRRSLVQDNIAKFIGAVLEPASMMIVHEYCPKGSLAVSDEYTNRDQYYYWTLTVSNRKHLYAVMNISAQQLLLCKYGM